MSDLASGPATTGRSSAGLLVAMALGSPPTLLAIAAVTGLGLVRGVPAGLALMSGMATTLLPILGLLSVTRRGLLSLVVCCWIWPPMLLSGLPLYFPGERSSAVADGLRLLAAPAGDDAANGLGEAGALLLSAFGSDSTPVAAQPTRSEIALAPDDTRPTPRTAGPEPGGPDERVVQIPYEGDERSLRVRVDIDGPTEGERFDMIFDTGATYTTMTRDALQAIGVAIPDDAPIVSLRTANGEIRAPLVLVDAFWLGDAVVEWITVAVCDGCAVPPSIGLLGLNVSKQFRVSLNHDRKRIELRDRRRSADRALDISQWLEIQSRAARSWSGSVALELTGRNQSQHEIESAVIDLDCNGDGFAIQLDHIPPFGESTTRLTLPRGTDCSRKSSIRVSQARWLLNRF
jgi:clan AA aspartic protease (TIGR02281 family)